MNPEEISTPETGTEVSSPWNPPACCTAFDDDLLVCEHKQRFFDSLAFVAAQGIPVGFSEDRDEAFQIARVDLMTPCVISVWIAAYAIYGWDVVTSALIHEFGHCKLYETEKRDEESLEVEKLATVCGRRFTPPELIPERYEHYQAFFLQTYEADPKWTKEKLLSEWRRMNAPALGG